VSVLSAEEAEGVSRIQEGLLISQAVVGFEQLIDAAASGRRIGQQTAAERGRPTLCDPHRADSSP
jgi:hypothetical protein